MKKRTQKVGNSVIDVTYGQNVDDIIQDFLAFRSSLYIPSEDDNKHFDTWGG